MAQYRLNAYDADVYIPEFKGLMQYGDPMGDDLRYSPDCMNVETPGGVLQPVPVMKGISLEYNGSDIAMDDCCTIMKARMTNRFGYNITGSTVRYMNGSVPSTKTFPAANGEEFDFYVFIVGTVRYTALIGLGSDPAKRNPLYTDSSIYTLILETTGSFAEEDVWSWCTYEHNYPDPPVHPTDPIGKTNILVMSSPKNGVYVHNGRASTKITDIPNFRSVACYMERIWGIGTGDDKDAIFYSRPYNVFDWSQATDAEQPEDGGGYFREPTFDKDKLTALVHFGDSLIAFSEQRAWRITGSDPSNFVIQEQFGNGTKYPKTIAVLDDRIIMLGDDGLMMYDGVQTAPFLYRETYNLFRMVRESGYSVQYEPMAAARGTKYVMALGRIGLSKYLIYDSIDHTALISDAPEVLCMCNDDPDMIMLTTQSPSNRLWFDVFQTDSFFNKYPTPSATRWVSPWIDLGRKDIQKGGFELYFYPELHTLNPADSVTLKFSIQTEKKTKTKTYVVHALTAEQMAAGREYRQKRLHFGGAGRRFRVIIETEKIQSGITVQWRLIGGIHIIAETDKD